MARLNPTVSEFRALYSAIESSQALTLGSPPANEPTLVARLAVHLTNQLNVIHLSRGHVLQSSAVFVHGRPQVTASTFPKPKPGSVEIGDLLLLRTHVHRGIVTERRAILFQAKLIDSIPAKPDNPNQHFLYSDGPWFKYVRSGRELNGQMRRVAGRRDYKGLQYLLIVKSKLPSPASCSTITPGVKPAIFVAEPTQPILSAYRCGTSELLDFVTGIAGREFLSPTTERSYGWDRVVDDLIRYGAQKSVIARRAGFPGGRRATWLLSGTPHPNGITAAQLSESLAKSPPDFVNSAGDELTAFSIVEVVVGTTDDQGPN